MTTVLRTRLARRGMITAAAAALALLTGCSAGGWPGAAPATSSASAAPSPTPSAAPAADPGTYTSTDFGYTVDFPAKPTVSTTQTTTMGLEVTIESVQYVLDDDSAVFAQAIRYPDGALASTAANVLLESSLTGLATSTNGTVLTKETAELDGAPAIRAEVDVEGAPGHGQYLLALHGDVEYVLFGYGEYADSFDSFIATFRFTD